MTHDVRAVANFVLSYAKKHGREITNIDVNKLVYFLHAWHLAKTGQPLVGAKIEAWQYGPVFRELYSQFKVFGDKPISSFAKKRDAKTLELIDCEIDMKPELEAFMVQVLDRYLAMSTGKLVEMSHVSGGPWDIVFNHQAKSNPGMHISNESIVEYFGIQTRH
ncbi:Panacea domain-containing protein [Roseibium sp.]|uniref:Panacea domain-containing protein n=1 Tax=Roseibium sp. TaxID=1936156 RepID=UPI003B519981